MKKTFTWKADSNPNLYYIFCNEHWFALVQLNGEIHVQTQEAHMDKLIGALNS